MRQDHVFRTDIEGLRAVAVLAVTLFHFDVAFLPGGFVGVDIFFVISGYLITGKILADLGRDRFSFADFYRARARRILPASLVTILLTVLAGAVLFPVDLFEELGRSAIWSLFFAANLFFASAAGYFDPSSLERPLLHYWSLAVEEQFYFVWPAVLAAGAALFGLRRSPWLVALLFLALLALSEAWIMRDPDGAYLQSPPRFFEFMLGAGLLFVEKPLARARLWLRDVLFAAGLAGLALPILLYHETIRFPGLTALPVAAATGLLILAGADSRLRGVLTNAPMRFFGRISYSLYLVHWPLVVFFKYMHGERMGALDKVGLLAAATALAWLMWRFVEERFRKGRGVALVHPYPVMAALFLAALLPAAAAISWQGMPWRLGEERAARLQTFQRDRIPSRCIRAEGGPQRSCVLGDAAQPVAKVVLLGDSHATPLRTPLTALLAERHVKGLSRSTEGCPPLTGASVNHERIPGWFRACQKSRRQVWKSVLRLPGVETVVLAARWSFYIRTERLGESAAKGRVFLAQTPDDERSAKRSAQVFRIAMRGTVETLLKAGKRVVLVGQAPELGMLPQRCLFAPLSRFMGDCSVRTSEQAKEDMRIANATMAALAKRYPDRVAFVNPLPIFCSEPLCAFERNGRFLYIDNNHMSPQGSILLVDRLRLAFDTIGATSSDATAGLGKDATSDTAQPRLR